MTDTDKELLELAAKAAGYIIDGYIRDGEGGAWAYPKGANPNKDGEYPIFKWNPRDDDGDTLRLAVKLKLTVEWDGREVQVYEYRYDDSRPRCAAEVEHDAQDYYAATRRAIVRAAAEIGRGMA